METQLVRLDKPYNIIFGKNGRSALHIATLIVIEEEEVKDPETGDVVKTIPVASSFPVVGGKYSIDGEVWMDSKLKDCLLICREGENVGLFALKKSMEYYSKIRSFDYLLIVPGSLSMALLTYGSKFKLPTDESKNTISDYEVCLEFSENNNGKSCIVYADKESDFYFYDYFDKEPVPSSKLAHINSKSIKYLAELRDSYVRAFHYEGLNSITFTTKDRNYQWFVDKLNSEKVDAAGL